jgi:hypothetical protein
MPYFFYEEDIANGKITFDDAVSLMKEAAEKLKELEDAGYFISPNKTQGVALYDWKKEVLEKWDGDESKLKIYARHSIIPLIPCLESKISNLDKKSKKELDKSILSGANSLTAWDTLKDRIENWEDIKKHYDIKTFHIAKISQSGKMKDRWLVIDAVKKADGYQVLLLFNKDGKDGMLT